MGGVSFPHDFALFVAFFVCRLVVLINPAKSEELKVLNMPNYVMAVDLFSPFTEISSFVARFAFVVSLCMCGIRSGIHGVFSLLYVT